MIPAIGLRIRDQEGIQIASLEGEIDIANASEVRDQLFALLSNRPSGLIVDLSDVSYLDSRGVHVMLELAERMKIRHQALRIVVPEGAMIRRILLLTHLDSVVPLDYTVDDAAARLRPER
jgi:anti-sigma B factor antagonist